MQAVLVEPCPPTGSLRRHPQTILPGHPEDADAPYRRRTVEAVTHEFVALAQAGFSAKQRSFAVPLPSEGATGCTTA